MMLSGQKVVVVGGSSGIGLATGSIVYIDGGALIT
jgi:NAD(P)-dependent dehydrogenase (short-subunit alcohol dehydrogenase family)